MAAKSVLYSLNMKKMKICSQDHKLLLSWGGQTYRSRLYAPSKKIRTILKTSQRVMKRKICRPSSYRTWSLKRLRGQVTRKLKVSVTLRSLITLTACSALNFTSESKTLQRWWSLSSVRRWTTKVIQFWPVFRSAQFCFEFYWSVVGPNNFGWIRMTLSEWLAHLQRKTNLRSPSMIIQLLMRLKWKISKQAKRLWS